MTRTPLTRSARKFTNQTGTSFGDKHGLDVANLGSVPYAIRVDEATTTVTYVGKATIGVLTSAASWLIFRITTTTTLTTVEWADADSNFDNVWDDRASLTYS